jgi:DNA-binding NtrC family response regulator
MSNTTVATPRPQVAAIQQFNLRVVTSGGADAGVVFSSSGARTVIGTDASADFVLHDPTVSRFHCEITLADGRALVRELESSNGTRVDGVSIVRAFLPINATLVLGETKLRFELRARQLEVPLWPDDRFGALVGRSTPMRALFAVLARAAQSDVTVLVEGETGTGKEAVAESIHRESGRSEQPFIVVDCGAIPPNLLASELFGHQKGAFTGADSARTGAFEAAHGGTLFLDEIGELSPELQPQVLRALEAREVKPIGQNRYRPIDVRVIAATNRDLRAEVNGGRFRADLFYRLAVLQVRIPPLRERRDDLPLLVEHMLAQLQPPDPDPVRAPGFLKELERHTWPGNVRELRNHVERCLALGRRLPFSPQGRTPAAGSAIDTTQPFKEAKLAAERRYLEKSLQLHDGNIAQAARTAELDRVQFYRLLWRHGLK